MEYDIWFQFITVTLPIIVAIIGYYYSKKLENLKEIRKIKAMLFFDLIQLGHKYSKDTTANEKKNYDKTYTEIADKLCLYANEEVLINISKINDFYFKNKSLTTSIEGQMLYAELILTMRRDVGLKTKKINHEIINKILALAYLE